MSSKAKSAARSAKPTSTPKAASPAPRTKKPRIDLSPYPLVALVLQGGGALGAYQAGAYAALTEEGIHPNWVAGISIGAINGSIIAGNAPAERADKLRGFWRRITTPIDLPAGPAATSLHPLFNMASAMSTALIGQPGFFAPRLLSPWIQQAGAPGAVSYYDTAALAATLEEFVDFDRIAKSGETRLSVGAVNVRTGNFAYFDSARERIRPAHIMASGALPPGFPAIEIEGEMYWDGGLVSNSPLEYVLTKGPRISTMVFQIDLFSARGDLPTQMPGVFDRQKDIVYSSRTRANTDSFKRERQARADINYLLEKLPAKLRQDPHVQHIAATAKDDGLYNIVHLIYRRQSYEFSSKDYEFSRGSEHEHFDAGLADTRRTLQYPEWFRPPSPERGVRVHDVHCDAED
jgi:NTE family protein